MVVPDLRRLVPGQDAIVFAHAPGYVGYDRYDDLVARRTVSTTSSTMGPLCVRFGRRGGTCGLPSSI